MRRFGQFLTAAGKWGVSLMTGGLLSFGVAVIEHFRGRSFTAITFTVIAFLAIMFGAYFAWDEANSRLACKDEEINTLKVKLGECRVTCEVDAVYISAFREYLGRTFTTTGYRLPQGNYKFEAGYSHVIVDALFSNVGGIETNIWDFNLSIKMPDTGVEFTGMFLKGQQEFWYLTKQAGLLQDRIAPQEDYSRLSVDWEIDNDDLLKRGNPKQCWVHFKVKGLPPSGCDNVSCILKFRDGMRANECPFTANFIQTAIEHYLE
jgi:hypothetical protein